MLERSIPARNPRFEDQRRNPRNKIHTRVQVQGLGFKAARMVPRIEPQLLTAVLRGWRNGTRGVKDAKDFFVVADGRGVSTVAPAWAPEREPTSTSSEIEDFASKILSEMRGRKGEEVQSLLPLSFCFLRRWWPAVACTVLERSILGFFFRAFVRG